MWYLNNAIIFKATISLLCSGQVRQQIPSTELRKVSLRYRKKTPPHKHSEICVYHKLRKQRSIQLRLRIVFSDNQRPRSCRSCLLVIFLSPLFVLAGRGHLPSVSVISSILGFPGPRLSGRVASAQSGNGMIRAWRRGFIGFWKCGFLGFGPTVLGSN